MEKFCPFVLNVCSEGCTPRSTSALLAIFGIVHYFVVHSVEIKGKQTIHAFAVVNWLKSSEQDLGFGNPLSVWLPNNVEHGGPAVFLPVQRIHFRKNSGRIQEGAEKDCSSVEEFLKEELFNKHMGLENIEVMRAHRTKINQAAASARAPQPRPIHVYLLRYPDKGRFLKAATNTLKDIHIRRRVKIGSK